LTNLEDNKKAFQRRDFFGALFAKVLEPVVNAVESKVERIEQIVEKVNVVQEPVGPTPLLPPGVLSESNFIKACQRTGECIGACPVQAIKPLASPDPRVRHTPHVMPETQACVLCEELPCINACPSGALMPVAREKVRMGLAVVHYDLCLRVDGEDCSVCIQQCPMGEKAIALDEHDIVTVNPEGCTGCGVCAMVCPAPMRAIMILPHG